MLSYFQRKIIVAIMWLQMAGIIASRRLYATAWVSQSRRRGGALPRLFASTAETSSTEVTTTERARQQLVNGRLPRNDLSLDLRTVTQHLETVKSHLTSRRAGDDTIRAAQTIADLADKRVALIQARDAALNRRKEASAVVGKLMRNRDDLDDEQENELEAAREDSTRAAAEAARAEEELAALQTTMDDMLAGIPNLLDDQVPDGNDETENEEVYKWGDLAALPAELGWTDDFEPAWHDDVAAALGGYETDRAVGMSGTRFVALSGAVARLERALGTFFMDLHCAEHGYREVSVPYVVSRTALTGTSQLPKFQEDLFAITADSHTCNGEDAFLIPTAEVPVTNLHRDQVLEEADLPLSYVAWTPCFRAEAGSYGRDTKGLIRTHQFQKVELVKITTPDQSDEQHELLTQHAEKCLQALRLPYRKVRLCSGDIGFSARHCYDLEVWLPGAAEYREISSCSNTGDFQARRMALRYRPKPTESGEGTKKKKAKKSKPVFCHTINGSGLAVGRTLVAVLENYQKPDGSVVVPEVLRPYMGGKEILEVPSGSK
jgi:seryl-tRNA synthetase